MSAIIIVRHVESEKNVADRFATPEGDEPLTAVGRRQLEVLATSIGPLLDVLGGRPGHVYSGTSTRVNETAEPIAEALGVDVRAIDNFDSFVSPVIAGMSFADLEAHDPDTAKQIRLYRAGAGNSYGTHPTFETAVRAFEKRVQQGVSAVLESETGSAVIVASRSAITAAVIHFARLEGFYPNDFYGFINLPSGSISLVKRPDVTDRNWSMEYVGSEISSVIAALNVAS